MGMMHGMPATIEGEEESNPQVDLTGAARTARSPVQGETRHLGLCTKDKSGDSLFFPRQIWVVMPAHTAGCHCLFSDDPTANSLGAILCCIKVYSIFWSMIGAGMYK